MLARPGSVTRLPFRGRMPFNGSMPHNPCADLDTLDLTRVRAAAPERRPVLHYTAEKTWLNDPNGLIFHHGLYHLYYQNNPFGNVWGNMSWGHATSVDLVHWEEHPVAIPCEEGEAIFSGSAVFDARNTSGLGTEEQPPLVAVYTSAYAAPHPLAGRQAQSLAYSLDGGFTWTKFAGNPVLDRASSDFRDPKVIRCQDPAGDFWLLVAVEAQEKKVVLYRSENLRDWGFLSDFGPANAIGGVWECPDLFPLPDPERPGREKWVLIVNLNPGGVAGGSGGQYFVGDFDGTRFTPDAGSLLSDGPVDADGPVPPGAEDRGLANCLWLDHGRDCYATVSFDSAPGEGRVLLGWMSNWDYAGQTPTDPWRSGMTLARRATLVATPHGLRLAQHPVLPEPRDGRRLQEAAGIPLEPGAPFALAPFPEDAAQRIRLAVRPGAETLTLRLFDDGERAAVVRYSPEEGVLSLDRRQSGDVAFHEKFASVEHARLTLPDGVLRLDIVLDRGSVEIFSRDGLMVLTDLVFRGAGQVEASLEGGAGAVLESLEVDRLS